MKKTLAFLLAMILALSLFTGTAAFAEETEPEEAAAAEEAVVETTDATAEDTAAEPEKLSNSEIIAMSNYMNRNGVVRSGKWTVRWAYVNNHLRMRSINQTAGQSMIIGEDKQPFFLVADGYYVYYISAASSADPGQIRRIRVSGGEDQMLIDCAKLGVQGKIGFLFKYDDHLFFSVYNEKTTPNSGAFFRSDMDGENVVTILEKAVYYPYIIRDKLYYQDDNDYSKIHVCNPDGTDDQVFIDDFSFDFYTDGISFYYTSYDGEYEWDDNHYLTNADSLNRALKIYTPGKGIEVIKEVVPLSMAFDGNTIYYSEVNDDSRLYTYSISTGKVDVLCFNDRIYDKVFYNNSTLICTDTNKSGLENVILMNKDGSGLQDAN